MKKLKTTIAEHFGSKDKFLGAFPGIDESMWDAAKDIRILAIDDPGTFICNIRESAYRKKFVSKHFWSQKVQITKLGQGADGARVFNGFYKWAIEYAKTEYFGEGDYSSNGTGWPATTGCGFWYCGYWMMNPDNGIGNKLYIHVQNVYFGIVFGGAKVTRENPLTGGQAFSRFRTICNHNGIDLFGLIPEDPDAVKASIPKANINLFCPTDTVYYNVHHMDFNSAYFAGIYQDYPVLRPAIDEVYKAKDIAKAQGDMDAYYINKAILNNTQGYCQSEYTVNDCGRKYALSNLAYSALTWTNNMIDDYMGILTKNDRLVLATNTDGIWYTGDVYEDENCGRGLGQYKTDAVNCTIRFKSKGAYEYMENGVYHPVVRGYTKMDMLGIDRDTWQWGDIYKYDGVIATWEFIKDEGWVMTYEENIQY